MYGRISAREFASSASAWAALGESLTHPGFDHLPTIVELMMPAGAERADIVVLGASEAQPRALVIELKLWSAAQRAEEAHEVFVDAAGRRMHPSLQALNYRGKLRMFHALAATYDVRAAVLAPNLPASAVSDLSETEWAADAPIFGIGQLDEFRLFAQSVLLPTDLTEGSAEAFAQASYSQSCHLLEHLTKHGKAIQEAAFTVLAEEGMGLTSEQLLVTDEILQAIARGEPHAFVIHGGPGSGKSLAALHLLLRAAAKGVRTAYAIRNSRLRAILKRCFDEAELGLSGVLHYFEGGHRGRGIGDGDFDGTFDFIVCDESQRMKSRSIPRILGRAPVVAFFLDESQRLNPPEEGTERALRSSAERLGHRVTVSRLPAAVRCRGGDAYHEWVDELLNPTGEQRARDLQKIWVSDQLVEVADSFDAMRERLLELRDANSARVGLAASFTEASGRGLGLIRIGYPLESGWDRYKESSLNVPWLMQDREYIAFWTKGRSSELDQIASIYGIQGFETDYLGLIWGRDLVSRAGRWTLGDPMSCFDSIEGLVNRGASRRWSQEAETFLRNRYRIFLTRGIRGTVIYAEDGETREHLRGYVLAK